MKPGYFFYVVQTSKYAIKHYFCSLFRMSYVRNLKRIPQKTKLILMAGNPRSGSTWQYNLVRLALMQAGYKVYASDVGKYIPSTKADYHIVKLHLIDIPLIKKAHLIFNSSRDFEGIKRSFRRIYGYYKEKEIVRNFLLWMEWEKYSNYDMSYGEFMSNKMKVIEDIINTLKLKNLDKKKLLEEMDSLRNPSGKDFSKGRDPVTLLHPNHISSKK